MKRWLLTTTLVFLSAPAIANACSCAGPEAGISRWVEANASHAKHIFLARVVSVSSKGGAGLGPWARVKILKVLKGSPTITRVDTPLLCPDFALTEGDTRVFFTDKDGVILGCSNYRSWLTNRGLLIELERVLKDRAT